MEIDWAAYSDEIGRRVAAVRRARGVSQTELAAVTGISRSQIQNIEQSRTSNKQSAGNTTIYRLFLIAQALGVPVRLLLPDGVPQADYRSNLDMAWPQLEVDIKTSVRAHSLPETTRPSAWIRSSSEPLPVTPFQVKLPDIDQA